MHFKLHGRINDEQSKAEWVFLIEQQNQSGMAMADFCRTNGISINAFYNARSRYGYTRQIPVSRDDAADISTLSTELSDFEQNGLSQPDTIDLVPV